VTFFVFVFVLAKMHICIKHSRQTTKPIGLMYSRETECTETVLVLKVSSLNDK